MRFSKHTLLFLFFTGSLFAQHLDFGFGAGVKGGFPFIDFLEPPSSSNGTIYTVHKSSDYIVGPVAEVRIPFGFAVEVNALYRNADYLVTMSNIVTTTSDVHAHSWEFPYLAKFRFPIPLLKPFVSAGGVYRTLTVPDYVTPTHNGVVLGGGLELRIRRLRLSGEAHWLHFGGSSSDPYPSLRSNQGEFLLGVIF